MVGVDNQIGLDLYNSIVSLAVPSFFATTGFLAGDRLDDEKWLKIIRKKYIRLYLIWNIVYLLITIWGFMYSSAGINKSLIIWIKGL